MTCCIAVAGRVGSYTFPVTSRNPAMAATVPIVVPTVAEAAAAFLDTCTAPGTRRSYTQTMTA